MASSSITIFSVLLMLSFCFVVFARELHNSPSSFLPTLAQNFGSSPISTSISSSIKNSPFAKYSPFARSPSTPKNSQSTPKLSYFTQSSPSSHSSSHYPLFIELVSTIETSSNSASRKTSSPFPSTTITPFPSSNAIESPTMKSPSSPINVDSSPTMMSMLSSPSTFMNTPSTKTPSLNFIDMRSTFSQNAPSEKTSPSSPSTTTSLFHSSNVIIESPTMNSPSSPTNGDSSPSTMSMLSSPTTFMRIPSRGSPSFIEMRSFFSQNVPSEFKTSPSSPITSTSPFPSSNVVESPTMISWSSPVNDDSSPSMISLSSPSSSMKTPSIGTPSFIEMTTPIEMTSELSSSSKNSPSSPYSSPTIHVQLNFTLSNNQPMEPGQGLVVIGSLPQLGDWRTYDAPMLENIYNNVWSTIVNIPSETSFEYKLVLVESNTKEALDWLEGESYKYKIPNHTSYVVVNIPWVHEVISSSEPVVATM